MFETVTLEMSLKPFKQTDDAYIKTVCRSFFEQWKPLLKDAKTVSVMLWAADGSELLDYRGDENGEFSWCNLIGGANPRESWTLDIDPQQVNLHATNYPYTENPPVMTYKILKNIVKTIKQVGGEMFPDKSITVGETVDPGPEFAKSDFKYDRHNEICEGGSMGVKSMISAANALHADDVSYAAFPDGIEEGTPFGTFFGRQAQAFLTDMGFDYIWFSNGLGFGSETWSAFGNIFDGKAFHTENFESVRKKVFDFWTYFRNECNFPIKTRGTNLSAGIDYATDGVPLKEIYDTVENLLPPPNSPWAALNGDFGLELMGHMSRICQAPGDRYLFRYYLHDPWWANSPWYDRYEGQPHDIYLPLSLAVMNKDGKIVKPAEFNILSIDNSFGDMPEACVNECLPHILKGLKDSPDAPAPVMWVYPFGENCSARSEDLLKEMYFEDFFVRSMINDGFPLSGVISTDSFVKCDKSTLLQSVLVVPVPRRENIEFEKQILQYIKTGGKVIFYGNPSVSSENFQKFIGVEKSAGKSGDFEVRFDGEVFGKISHDPVMSGGELEFVSAPGADVLATADDRVYATQGKTWAWMRGTSSNKYVDGQLPTNQDFAKYAKSESLMRKILAKMGLDIGFDAKPTEKTPVVMINRCDNGFMTSVYCPDTTVETRVKTALGAPVLPGMETRLESGYATYRFPRSGHYECRVFVEQEDGKISVREIPPVSYYMRRRISVSGLKNATVRFFSEKYCEHDTEAVLNSHNDIYIVGDEFEMACIDSPHGAYYEAKNITGTLTFSMKRN